MSKVDFFCEILHLQEKRFQIFGLSMGKLTYGIDP